MLHRDIDEARGSHARSEILFSAARRSARAVPWPEDAPFYRRPLDAPRARRSDRFSNPRNSRHKVWSYTRTSEEVGLCCTQVGQVGPNGLPRPGGRLGGDQTSHGDCPGHRPQGRVAGRGGAGRPVWSRWPRWPLEGKITADKNAAPFVLEPGPSGPRGVGGLARSPSSARLGLPRLASRPSRATRAGIQIFAPLAQWAGSR